MNNETPKVVQIQRTYRDVIFFLFKVAVIVAVIKIWLVS